MDNAMPMADGSSKMIEESYDTIAAKYLHWRTSDVDDAAVGYIEALLTRLDTRSDILELGCGAGVPFTQMFAQREHKVVAVDHSAIQLEMAKQNVRSPNVKFLKSDMQVVEFAKASFDAVAAFYSILHLTPTGQRTILQRISEWIRAGGYLLFNLAPNKDAGSVEAEWLGAPMYFSSIGMDEALAAVRQVGFEIVSAEVLNNLEDGRDIPFLWILARKTSSNSSVTEDSI